MNPTWMIICKDLMEEGTGQAVEGEEEVPALGNNVCR